MPFMQKTVYGYRPSWWKHLHVAPALFIMKLTMLLLMIALCNIHATVVSQSITFSGKEVPLKKVFSAIEKQTGYVVFYNKEQLANTRPVSLSVQDMQLAAFLEMILKDQPLNFRIDGKDIILSRKAPPKMITPAEYASQAVVVAQPPVRGRVLSIDGNPLSGAVVKIKGAGNGTSTDSSGFFTLNAKAGQILVVSYVGYQDKEYKLEAEENITIILSLTDSKLDEVAVVAFGTQRKSSMVSAIETISPKELKIASSNLTTALAGRLSGVIAYQRSGEPGRDNADFFIRGVTTFGYKKDPLILIDGIETSTTELARLQPDDIAAFSILKDATATALYGARGANGVIQVSTKQGVEGPAKVSLRFENSYSSNTKDLALADPVTFMRLANEAVLTRNPLAPLAYPREKIDNTVAGANPYLYPANDWRKLLIKNVAVNRRLNLNVTGGGPIARYYISAAVNQDNGNLNVEKRSNFNNNIDLKSYQLRSNININLTKTTEVIVRLSGSFDDYRGPVDGGDGMYRKIMHTNPVLFPAYFPASLMPNTNHVLFGNASRSSSGADYTNPYADMVKGYKDFAKSLMDAQFSLNQNLSFLTPGLSIRGMFNTSRYSYFDVSRYYNPYFYNVGFFDKPTNSYTLALLNENGNPTEYLNYNEGAKDINSTIYAEAAINYTRKINQRHDVGGMLVYQRRQQLYANQGSLQRSLPYRNQGLSGRFSYGYDSRYLLEFNFGYNGSERFYKTERYGFFPAIGAGWVLSNEQFWEKIRPVIQTLKLKATYGLVGNDAIGDANDRFFYLSDVNMNDAYKSYSFGENYGTSRNGVTVNRYDNRDISWEMARKTNLGVELRLFNGIDIQADYFTERRNNILMDRASIPASMGLAAVVRANVGEAKANGVDISVDYNKSFRNSLWIQARGNFTYAHSEFVKYEEPSYNEKYRSHAGRPLNQIYGLIAERLFVDEYEVNNSPKQNFGEYHAGDIKYTDVNNDGQVTDLDLVPIGYPTVPEIVYGFGLSTGYKGFDLSAFFQGSARSSFWLDATNTSPFQGELPLVKAYADDHWSEDNRNLYALWPRLSSTLNGNNVHHYSTWFMRNGAFLRMKTLEMGYTLPQRLMRRLHVSSARIYASGINLFLLSGFDLWDTEMGGNGLGYPVQKVINLGIQVKF
jgi:TonB-linked SusC/RagA family outer membrane protein